MMPSCLSILFRALRIEWRETKHTLFPTTPIETGLFLFFFLLYGCIGYRMLFHTELIDVQRGSGKLLRLWQSIPSPHARRSIRHQPSLFRHLPFVETLLTILLTTLFKEKLPVLFPVQTSLCFLNSTTKKPEFQHIWQITRSLRYSAPFSFRISP